MPDMDYLIDDALSGYPLEPLPPGFIARVMSRIRPRPKFRLHYLDIILPAFTGVFGILIVSVTLLTLPLFDPLFWPRLELYWKAFLLRLAALPPLPISMPVLILSILSILLGIVTVLILIPFSKPTNPSRHISP